MERAGAVRTEAPSAWFVLVGNKKDVASRNVSAEEAMRVAEQWDGVYRECSAFSGENLDEIFMLVAEKVRYERPAWSGAWSTSVYVQGDGARSSCCA